MAEHERHRRDQSIKIASERDLQRNIRAISRRFNDNPNIARLVFVNPILALEDVGVDLSPEAKEHIMGALRYPPRLAEQRERLEAELKKEFVARGVEPRLPLSSKRRATLLFEVLGLEPLEGDREQLTSGRAAAYADRHELVDKLARYERARRGALIFHSRKTYEAFKRGDRRNRWIRTIRFDV